MKNEKRYLIEERTFDFSLNIISLYQELMSQKEYVLSKQLLRAGTSIGANVVEAGAAQSKRDFIAKMSIASKEARETRYWLKLYEKSELVNHFSTRRSKKHYQHNNQNSKNITRKPLGSSQF